MKFNELLSPGICVICEGGMDGIEFYDTNYNLELDTMIYLSGRKYVCELCFTAMAEHWGYEASNQIEQAESAKEDVKAELTALYAYLDKGRDEVMTRFRQVDAVVTRPRGRPRKNPLPVDGD